MPQSIGQHLFIVEQVFPVLLAVLLHSRQEPGHGLHKRIIIHNRVPLIALQPGGCVPVMLRIYHSLRVCFLHVAPEIFPEPMVKLRRQPQIRCHIQTPSVYVIRGRNPLPGNPHNVIVKLLRSLIGKLGECIVSPPAVIKGIVGPLVLIVKFEKTPVWAVRRNVGTFFVVFVTLIKPLAIQPFIKRSAVVKYTVQHYPDPPLVHLFHKTGKKFIAGFQILFMNYPLNVFAGLLVILLPFLENLSAVLTDHRKVRINIIIILTVIFVVGR